MKFNLPTYCFSFVFFLLLKRWVRLATVVGYLISVCIPAIALSVYYVGFWDPQYELKVITKTRYSNPSVTNTRTLINNKPLQGHRRK